MLTLDCGFYSTAVVSCLQEADLEWIMPCTNTPQRSALTAMPFFL